MGLLSVAKACFLLWISGKLIFFLMVRQRYAVNTNLRLEDGHAKSLQKH